MKSTILNWIGIDPGYILIGLAGFILILLLLLIISMVKIRKLKKKYNQFMKNEEGKSLETIILDRFEQVDSLAKSNEENSEKMSQIIKLMESSYQKVGMSKYDAFNEMGGELSFALAMLDGNNNGFLMNSMHSREGCYTYIKEIMNGQSTIALSEEENKALERAIQG